jgi:hypothetical protein
LPFPAFINQATLLQRCRRILIRHRQPGIVDIAQHRRQRGGDALRRGEGVVGVADDLPQPSSEDRRAVNVEYFLGLSDDAGIGFGDMIDEIDGRCFGRLVCHFLLLTRGFGLSFGERHERCGA